MSMAIAYQVKKRANKMAKGGEVKGVHKDEGLFDQGSSRAGIKAREYAKDSGSSNSQKMGVKRWIKGEHNKVLDEMREMPKPNLKGLADGGMIGEQSKDDEADMISRIMKKRYSKGGEVANDTDFSADEQDADFDYMAHNDELAFHETAANSGDEDNDHDIVARIMRKKRG